MTAVISGVISGDELSRLARQYAPRPPAGAAPRRAAVASARTRRRPGPARRETRRERYDAIANWINAVAVAGYGWGG